MNRVKRWTMTSWVDGVLAQIENHEANVYAAIVRVRKSTARARVQLRRVERDQTTLRDTLAAEDEAMSAWLRRAEQTAALRVARRWRGRAHSSVVGGVSDPVALTRWAALAAFGLALVALTAVLERRARAVRVDRREVASRQPLDRPLPSV